VRGRFTPAVQAGGSLRRFRRTVKPMPVSSRSRGRMPLNRPSGTRSWLHARLPSPKPSFSRMNSSPPRLAVWG